MIEAIAKNNEIAEFLECFPKQHWFKCIESVLLIGIQTLKEKHEHKLSIERLVDLAVKKPHKQDIKQKLELMKQEIENLSPAIRQLTERPKQRPLPSSSRTTPKRPPHGTSNFKAKVIEARRPSPKAAATLGRVSSDKKIPKYLKNVQSRIGDDVAKDIAKHRKDSSYREAQPDSHHEQSSQGEGFYDYRREYEADEWIKRKRYDDERSNERALSETRREPYDSKSRRQQEEAYDHAPKRSDDRREDRKENTMTKGQSYGSPIESNYKPDVAAYVPVLRIEEPAVSHYKGNLERELYEEKYNLPRQIPAKTPPRPPPKASPFIEPKTCDINEVSHLLNRSKATPTKATDSSETGELLRIAEQFLTDPYMNQLYRTDSRLSIPSSPKNLEHWLASKDRLFDSYEYGSPKQHAEY
mmetsp:Transcript_344/g.399  ORF Transcript_344/g.399 Transcript_344/m.399 type:complete len:413 (-) Transcript_344:23-1261(-)